MKIPEDRIKVIASTIIAVFLLSIPIVYGQSNFKPVFHPSATLTHTTGKITIDGKLDDPGWQGATMLGNFVERYPGDNIQPDVRTEIKITYDEKKLYVAYNCYDDPSAVRATMCQRDQFSDNDAVYLLIDPYGNASWAYELFANPYGIQKDLLWTKIGDEDIGFDLVWESYGRITDSGYQVEMAVPFANMRFPNKPEQSWRMDFWRYRPRATEKTYSWAAYNRGEQCWPCQWGTVDGIKNIHPGTRGIELMPALVASQYGALEGDTILRFKNDDAKAELSLGAKYTINSDITAEAAINPDFSQVEADADQIDVNTTIALMYPERRPYFKEGADLFRTLFNSFYTRTINNPEYTAKVTARSQGLSACFLTAYDKNTPYMIPLEEGSILFDGGKSLVNVARGLKTFGNSAQVGFFISDRRFEKNGSGTVVALDDDIRLTKTLSIDGQYILTYTQESEDTILTSDFSGINFADNKHTAIFDGEYYWGTALISRIKHRSRNMNLTMDFNQVSPSYRTETGYDPLVNYRNLSLYGSYQIYPTKGVFERITPQFYSERRVDFDGNKRRENTNLGFESQMKIAQIYLSGNYGVGSENWAGHEFNNLWEIESDFGIQPNNQLGFFIEFDYGLDFARRQLAKCKTSSINSSLTLKPISALVIEPNFNYFHASEKSSGEELYDGYITRIRTQFQMNRQLSLRLVVQYNDFGRSWDIDPLLTYRISPFSLFYIGSTHDLARISLSPSDPEVWRQISRQYFLKLQYLFQG
jgi:hypothetical protein